jgi:hypothetical protein
MVAVGSFGAGVVVLADSAGFAAAGAGACFGATLSGRDEEMIAGSSAGVATVGGGGPPAARRAGGVYRLGCPEARGWKLRWTPLYLEKVSILRSLFTCSLTWPLHQCHHLEY